MFVVDSASRRFRPQPTFWRAWNERFSADLRDASYEETETEWHTEQVRDRFDQSSQRLSQQTRATHLSDSPDDVRQASISLGSVCNSAERELLTVVRGRRCLRTTCVPSSRQLAFG